MFSELHLCFWNGEADTVVLVGQGLKRHRNSQKEIPTKFWLMRTYALASTCVAYGGTSRWCSDKKKAPKYKREREWYHISFFLRGAIILLVNGSIFRKIIIQVVNETKLCCMLGRWRHLSIMIIGVKASALIARGRVSVNLRVVLAYP